jgi:hypothetical protein
MISPIGSITGDGGEEGIDAGGSSIEPKVTGDPWPIASLSRNALRLRPTITGESLSTLEPLRVLRRVLVATRRFADISSGATGSIGGPMAENGAMGPALPATLVRLGPATDNLSGLEGSATRLEPVTVFEPRCSMCCSVAPSTKLTIGDPNSTVFLVLSWGLAIMNWRA